MENLKSKPHKYHKKVGKDKNISYIECANYCNATTMHYSHGLFYAKFETDEDFKDFVARLKIRNLPL